MRRYDMPERPFEGFVPPHERSKQEAEASPETEPIRRVFEYRDAEGRILGTAEAEFDAEAQPMPYKAAKDGAAATGRRLRSFVLRGEKDGRATAIDMLALAVPAGVEVVSSDVPLANYHYEHQEKRALVPPLETPLDVGVFLHELGHAEQHREKRFEKITPLYGQAKPFASGTKPVSVDSFLELLDAVNDAIPDVRSVFDEEAREQLARLEGARREALDRKSAVERALEEQEMLRDAELQTLLSDALAAHANLAAVTDEARRVGLRESHPVPPLVASPEVEALLIRLEAAGIRFEGSDGDVATVADESKGVGFGAAEPRASRMVQRRTITTADQAAAVVGALTEARAVDADVRYDETSETMTASLTVEVPHVGPGRIIIEARVPDHQFAQYAKIRNGADAIVMKLAHKGDVEYEEAEAKGQAERHLLDAVNLGDIAALPTRMMERDATRRALRWLRQVRDKTNINLLVPHLVQWDRLVGSGPDRQEDCIGSTVDGMEADHDDGTVETTILEDLRRALEGYGAARLRLRPPDQGDHLGITPVAGRERPQPEKDDK